MAGCSSYIMEFISQNTRKPSILTNMRGYILVSVFGFSFNQSNYDEISTNVILSKYSAFLFHVEKLIFTKINFELKQIWIF